MMRSSAEGSALQFSMEKSFTRVTAVPRFSSLYSRLITPLSQVAGTSSGTDEPLTKAGGLLLRLGQVTDEPN